MPSDNPYSSNNNPFATQHSSQDTVQVGGASTQGAADQVARQRMSSIGRSSGGKGGKGGAWQAIIKAALGGISGGLTGAANSNSNTNNPFGSGFNNQNNNPFGG